MDGLRIACDMFPVLTRCSSALQVIWEEVLASALAAVCSQLLKSLTSYSFPTFSRVLDSEAKL